MYDTPMPPGGLHAAMILNKKPHARLLSIDDFGARSSPGFARIFFAKDILGDNATGPIVEDEQIFASDIYCHLFWPRVVANTHENAKGYEQFSNKQPIGKKKTKKPQLN
ncbi:hypothetical protein LXL04_035307 [Taraxacum kok-saghyz]